MSRIVATYEVGVRDDGKPVIPVEMRPWWSDFSEKLFHKGYEKGLAKYIKSSVALARLSRAVVDSPTPASMLALETYLRREFPGMEAPKQPSL